MIPDRVAAGEAETYGRRVREPARDNAPASWWTDPAGCPRRTATTRASRVNFLLIVGDPRKATSAALGLYSGRRPEWPARPRNTTELSGELSKGDLVAVGEIPMIVARAPAPVTCPRCAASC